MDVVRATSVIIPPDVKKEAKSKAVQLDMSFQDYLTKALKEKNEKES